MYVYIYIYTYMKHRPPVQRANIGIIKEIQKVKNTENGREEIAIL